MEKYKEITKLLNEKIEKFFGNNSHYYVICSNSKKYVDEIYKLFPNLVVKRFYNKIYLKNNISIIFISNKDGARPLIDYVSLKEILINYSRLDYEKYLSYFRFLLRIERQRNIDILSVVENLDFIKGKEIIKSYQKNKDILVNLEELLEDMITPKPTKDGGFYHISEISPQVILNIIRKLKEE